MTDTELAMAVAERLRLREAEATAAGDKRRLTKLVRFHRALEKLAGQYLPGFGMEVAPLSGGIPKPD
jgi:hypothetical protein